MPPYRWLFFDADDTLFDYDLAEAAALRRTFADSALPFDEAYGPLYQRINSAIWRRFEARLITSETLRVERWSALFAEAGITADAAAFSECYLGNLAQCTDLTRDALEVVQALAPRYQLAIITNGLKQVQRPRLARSAVGPYFSVLAISEEIGAAKPDPRFFDAAFALAGQPARSEVLVIGDSLTSDIRGGLNYGLDTCWYNHKGLPADPTCPSRYEIAHLKELLVLL